MAVIRVVRQLPVRATFNVKSNIFAPKGVPIGTSPVLIVAGNVDKRLSIWIANDSGTSGSTIYLGGHNGVSATQDQANTGWPLWTQAAMFMDDIDHEIWAVGAAAGLHLIYVETFMPDDVYRGIGLQAPPVTPFGQP